MSWGKAKKGWPEARGNSDFSRPHYGQGWLHAEQHCMMVYDGHFVTSNTSNEYVEGVEMLKNWKWISGYSAGHLQANGDGGIAQEHSTPAGGRQGVEGPACAEVSAQAFFAHTSTAPLYKAGVSIWHTPSISILGYCLLQDPCILPATQPCCRRVRQQDCSRGQLLAFRIQIHFLNSDHKIAGVRLVSSWCGIKIE